MKAQKEVPKTLSRTEVAMLKLLFGLALAGFFLDWRLGAAFSVLVWLPTLLPWFASELKERVRGRPADDCENAQTDGEA